jgi:LmbE family N-acetylglucosaminyl deacetylase
MTLSPDPGPWIRGDCRVGVVVAHPDDEVLWAGGLLLSLCPERLFICTLCRGRDPDRAPRFREALARFGAEGAMGDLDDGPEQTPLPPALVEETMLSLLPGGSFDLLLTHGPEGEYTRHERHIEVSRGLRALVDRGNLACDRLWTFAYEDRGGTCMPRPRRSASLILPLGEALWARKIELLTVIYGFTPASWEARAAPRAEAFTCHRQTGPPPP